MVIQIDTVKMMENPQTNQFLPFTNSKGTEWKKWGKVKHNCVLGCKHSNTFFMNIKLNIKMNIKLKLKNQFLNIESRMK